MPEPALGCSPPHLPEITGVFHQGPEKDCPGECVASQTLAEVFRLPSFKSKNVVAGCSPLGGQDPFQRTLPTLICNFQESRSIPQTNNSETKKICITQ